jgi:UDP-GlcNAc:undecaprenyl-phosphate/decaprenyl-phosphate GlcNAc-1-phosphate transferase
MRPLPELVLTLLSTLVLSQLLMPVARRIGQSWGLLDHPSWRRSQKAAVPCSGGLAIYATGVVAAAVLVATHGIPFRLPALAALGIAGLGTLVLGVVDDRFGLHAEKKLLGQILVISLPMAAGLSLHEVYLPFVGSIDLGMASGPVTLFWYLGFINSLNLIDGLDGLAGGIAVIVLATFSMVMVGADPMGALWTVALLGAVLGFLRHNLSEDRIFLGDAGSMLLGLWLAGLSLGFAGRTPGLPLLAALAMIVPVVDTSSTILRRWRRHVSVFRPDAEHLHHRLLALGSTPRRATVCLWFFTLAAASAGAALLGFEGAAIVTLGAASAGAIELAYTIQQDRHPRLRRVFGYLLGIHTNLFPIDPAEHLADVIEMTSYRRRSPGELEEEAVAFSPSDAPAVAAGVSADASSSVAPAPESDVVLAAPEESS